MRKNSSRTSSNLKWFLVPVFVLIGLIGGAAGGVIGPIALEVGRPSFPPRFFVLFAGIGALVGTFSGLLSGLVAVWLDRLLRNRVPVPVTQGVLAIGAFGVSGLLGVLVLGYLYLVSLADC